MLQGAFDAVAMGLPVPLSDTPMKMLPKHAPPPIYRASVKVVRSMSPRSLQRDVNLYNETLDVDMGRVLSRTSDKEKEVVVSTPIGCFRIDNKSRLVIRGKIETPSIVGTKVREFFPNA